MGRSTNTWAQLLIVHLILPPTQRRSSGDTSSGNISCHRLPNKNNNKKKFNAIELNKIKDDVNTVILTLQSLSAYVEVWSECWQRSATSGFRDN